MPLAVHIFVVTFLFYSDTFQKCLLCRYRGIRGATVFRRLTTRIDGICGNKKAAAILKLYLSEEKGKYKFHIEIVQNFITTNTSWRWIYRIFRKTIWIEAIFGRLLFVCPNYSKSESGVVSSSQRTLRLWVRLESFSKRISDKRKRRFLDSTCFLRLQILRGRLILTTTRTLSKFNKSKRSDDGRSKITHLEEHLEP